MTKILDRLRREPIVSRLGLAAVLNVLVVAGVLDTAASTEVETAVLTLVNLVALATGRAKVTPVAPK